MSVPPTTPRQDNLLAVINCAIAAVVLVAVARLVFRDPFEHSECPIYLRAAWDWWAGRSLYAHNVGIDGFLYLPQFALLYSPFAALDPILRMPSQGVPIEILPIGDILWRALCTLLFMTGLWRLAGAFAHERRAGLFNLLVWMAFPAALASLRNGQANLPIAALMLQTFADLREKNWWRATAWLVAGFFIKPVLAVMMLLTAVGYRKMPARLAIGFLAALALPFAFQNPHYALDQYTGFLHTMRGSAAPDREFCNLHGLLAKFGLNIAPAAFQRVSIVAAGATLALWLPAIRRPEPFRAFFLLALSASYIPLFNPRTESSAYVMLSPVIAISAAVSIFILKKRAVGGFLIALAFCLICDSWAYHFTENWLKPLACLLYFLVLAVEILCDREIRLDTDEPFPLPAMSQ